MGTETGFPLRVQFARWHPVCDRCGEAVSGSGDGYRQTAAGMFAYRFCKDCAHAVWKMKDSEQGKETVAAMVRHAEHYSPEYGRFVAAWFGVAPAKAQRRKAA